VCVSPHPALAARPSSPVDGWRVDGGRRRRRRCGRRAPPDLVRLACVPGTVGRCRRSKHGKPPGWGWQASRHTRVCSWRSWSCSASAGCRYTGTCSFSIPHTGICFIKPLHGHLLLLCTPTKAPAASLYRYTGTCSSSTSAGSRTRAGTRNDSPEAAPHGRARWYAVFRVACHVLAYSNSCINPFIYHYGAAARRVTLNLYRTGLTSGRADRHRNDAVRFPVRTRKRAASAVATA